MMDSMGWSVVYLAALLAPAVLILNGLFQRWRHAEATPGWFTGIVMLLAVLTGGALVFAAVFGGADVLFLASLLVLAVAEVIVGLAVWALIERRAEAFSADRSFGILTAALGGLMAVLVLVVPILPGQLTLTQATPTLPVTTSVLAISPTPAATQTPSPVPSPTIPPTVTPTPSPAPTETPAATATRIRYMTPTPSLTPTVLPVCGAVAEYNLNLRTQPMLDAPIMNVIPYQSVIEIAGRDSAGEWWFARYEGAWGWLDGTYLSLDTDCAPAPILAD